MTASSRVLTISIGTTFLSCCAKSFPISPKQITDVHLLEICSRRSFKGRFFPRPPRSKMIGFVKLFRAAIVRSGVVAILSLIHGTPYVVPTVSSRGGRPGKLLKPF